MNDRGWVYIYRDSSSITKSRYQTRQEKQIEKEKNEKKKQTTYINQNEKINNNNNKVINNHHHHHIKDIENISSVEYSDDNSNDDDQVIQNQRLLHQGNDIYNNDDNVIYTKQEQDEESLKDEYSIQQEQKEEVQDMLNPINKIFKHNKKHKKDINTTSTKTTTNLIESKNNQNHQNQPCQQQQQQQQEEEDQLQPCQQGEPSSTESTPPNESIISEINNNIKNNNNKSPEMESGITEEKYYKQHPIDDDDDSIYASPTSSTSSIISSASSTVNTPVPSPSSSPMYLTLSSADSPLPSLSSILGPISFSDSSENPDIPLTTVLKGIVVEDLDGNEVLLTDLWAKKRCIIAVFRRFGCLVCRLQALDLSSIKPKLDQLGIQMIGIGFDPTGLAEFIHGQFFQGTIYLDRTRAIHRSLCLKRMGFWDSAVGFTDPRLTVYRKRAKDIGLPHNFKGDGMQLGATLVIGPQPQDAHYDFRQRGFTDIFDLNQILKACKNPLPQKAIQKERYKLPAPIHLPCSPIHFNLELKPKNNNYNNNNNNSISQPKKTIYHFGNKDYHLTTKEQQPQQKEIDPQLLQKVEELSNQLLSTGIKNFDDVFNIPTIENFIKNVHISNNNNNNIIVNNNKNNNKKNDKKHKLSNNSKLWMKLEPETDLIYLPY